MIAIYTKVSQSAEPVLRFEHAAPLDAAVREVIARYPEYVGEEPAPDARSRSVGWFKRQSDGRLMGIGYDILPEQCAALSP